LSKRVKVPKVPTGTSLKIYLTLLSSSEPLGVREIQHRVGLKSPSTVKYHLDRLRNYGLVKQLPDGRYVAVKDGNPLTSIYLFFRASPIPRILPITLGFASFIITYELLGNVKDPILILAVLIFTAYVVVEALNLRSLIKSLLE